MPFLTKELNLTEQYKEKASHTNVTSFMQYVQRAMEM